MTTEMAAPVATTRSTTRPRIVGGPTPAAPFPIKMQGIVIKGFGRGSKELGIPTANLPEEAIKAHEYHMETGIYYGWAQVIVRNPDHTGSSSAPGSSAATTTTTTTATATTTTTKTIESTADSTTTEPSSVSTVYPMVMSLGWNPFYKNEKKSAEVHIMHNFHRDFYGDELRVVVLGYIRPELDYTTLEALIEDINIDIEVAHRSLERAEYTAFKDDALFQET
ncbi:riboflavin kinase [Mortierella claussenii]|nr:riboflavin kinase [Mortierella claussenii]